MLQASDIQKLSYHPQKTSSLRIIYSWFHLTAPRQPSLISQTEKQCSRAPYCHLHEPAKCICLCLIWQQQCWDVSVKDDQVYCKTACPHLIKDYTFCCYCNTCHKMTETNNVCPSRRFLISLTCLLHSAPGPFLPTAMGHRCLEFFTIMEL